jgi:alpha-glucosidase
VYHSRDGARTPIPWRSDSPHAGFSTSEPWLPVDPSHYPLAVDLQEAEPASVLQFTRKFLAWRKPRAVLRTGAITFLDAPEPVLVFLRSSATERLMCAFNLGSGTESVRIDTQGDPLPLTGHGLAGRIAGDRLELPPHGAIFAVLR